MSPRRLWTYRCIFLAKSVSLPPATLPHHHLTRRSGVAAEAGASRLPCVAYPAPAEPQQHPRKDLAQQLLPFLSWRSFFDAGGFIFCRDKRKTTRALTAKERSAFLPLCFPQYASVWTRSQPPDVMAASHQQDTLYAQRSFLGAGCGVCHKVEPVLQRRCLSRTPQLIWSNSCLQTCGS